MRKTMIYLEDEQFVLLKRAASASRKNMAEIIREALAGYFSERKEKINYFSFVGIAEGPRKGRTSEKAEDVLREIMKK